MLNIYLKKTYFVKIEVLEAPDYVDRVLDVHLFLFAKISLIFECFMKVIKNIKICMIYAKMRRQRRSREGWS